MNAPDRGQIKSGASDRGRFSRMIRRLLMAADNPGGAPDEGAPVVPPRPHAAFRWTRESWGAALRAAPLEAHAKHLFTSSQLRLPADADDEERERAWIDVTASLDAPRRGLLRVRQVHGRIVRIVRGDDPSAVDPTALPAGDAIVSNVPGTTLAVVVADCVPILIVDPRGGAAAAVHAGWRGTCAGVAGAAVDAMRSTWGTQPADLWAAIGPSIGPADYQVGDSVLEEFRQAGHGEAGERWFTRGPAGRLRLDLWRANIDQLAGAGLRPERIFAAGLSTAAHPRWLESYRRDGAAAGRLVAAIATPAAICN
jgi:YfiH family protein